MTKINSCLKCIFIFFNVLFAIFGCLLMYGTLKVTVQSQQLSAFGAPNLGWSWVFAIGVLGVSSLGIYAACSEKPVVLKIFAGFMGVGMVIMLIFGFILAVANNKLEDIFKTSDVTKQLMQNEDFRGMLQNLQQTNQCCGLENAEDWGSDIPDSCSCRGYSGCTARPLETSGPSSIYKKPCSDIIIHWVNIAFQISMGIFFTFAVTALLGLLISLLMVHQVKRYDNIGATTIAMRGY
ncbi:tetraspanin-8-like [Betta splendens]|uniref:Tetraspanin n=1 Tax=Betta splendens TaxID=158456 RepID=A0A6P7NLF0_BETSP|nr:tetraspanin-8-like [Betta splendens]